MKLKTSIAALVLCCTSTASFGALQDDNYIQHSDDQYSRMEIDPRLYQEIKRFIEQGMPPASVMLHAVSLGVPIDDVVEMCTRADTSMAQQFYDTAISLLPSLPGWACRANGSHAGRNAPNFARESLGPQPSVNEVASRYFDSRARLMPFPDWQKGEAHIQASTEELLNLLDDNAFWYQPGDNANATPSASFDPRRPIFVSLYNDKSQVVIDSDPRVIRAAAAAGLPTLPVVFIYNEENQMPLSRMGDNAQLRDVASRFFDNGKEVTPVPEWRTGDFHMKVETDEVTDMFDIPNRDQIDPVRWSELEADLRVNGFKQPLKVTFLRDGERMWVDQPERAAVAASMGMQNMPVVYYYHGFDRMSCGAEAMSCQDMVCDAAIAGGASGAVCNRSTGTDFQNKSFGPLSTHRGSMGGAPVAGCETQQARDNNPACDSVTAPAQPPREPKKPTPSASSF